MKLTKSWGMRLLGTWALLSGLFPLLNVSFDGKTMIMNVLAIVAGVFVLINK